ncbi:PQQ-binding-like beta-propeller repeat protein [Nocardia asteroides]|uniref:outer membrane protein assembly factor BamB family protein n=1 Tax=Nocardia asteroides TaxID=1824 RepID=UPI00379C911B
MVSSISSAGSGGSSRQCARGSPSCCSDIAAPLVPFQSIRQATIGRSAPETQTEYAVSGRTARGRTDRRGDSFVGDSTAADRTRTTLDDSPRSLPTLERPLGRLAPVRALAAAVGTGLLAGGVALALVSRFGTTTVSVRDSLAQPTQFAMAAAVLGGLTLLITLAAWLAGRRRTVDLWTRQHDWEQFATAAIVLMIVILAGMSWREHLPSSYDTVRATLPYFTQLPTAAAATILVAIGAILVLPLTIHMGVSRTIGRGAVTVATAVGLVIAATVGALAIHAGDDNANIDHRTADSTSPPALPARVNAEAYRLELPPLNNRAEATGRQVLPAGTGFIVAGVDGLRAYDGATGEPRWHYLRRPQSGKRVFALERGTTIVTADRSVVTTRWEGPSDQSHRITFDAVTGRILWTSDDDNDFTVDEKDRPARLFDSPAAEDLIVETTKRIEAYDARTAARLWSTSRSDSGCKSTDAPIQVTADAIYHLLKCGSTWRVTALSARTGDVVGSRDLPGNSEPDLDLLSNTLMASWGGPGAAYLLANAPDQLASAPIRSGTRPSVADPDGPAVLVKQPDSAPAAEHTAALTSIHDTASTPVPELTAWSRDSLIFLTDQIINLNFEESPTLSLWDRRNLSSPSTTPFASSCRPKQTVPHLLLISSAVLMVCQNNEAIGDATLDIIGFR